MRDATFFTRPVPDWQRRYEALRAAFVERQPDQVVAERFGYSPSYISLLKHKFRHGKIDLAEPVLEGRANRHKVDSRARQLICDYRRKNLSAGDITELLSEDGFDLSVRTVERVLAEEGFTKLARRTRLKIGRTVKGAQVPERAKQISLTELEGKTIPSAAAGVFLFLPFLSQLRFDKIVQEAGLPGNKYLSALNYTLSILALKLLGEERYAHVTDHSFDSGLGLFAGLNLLPKCTALSTYSYSLDQEHILKLQEAFVKRALKLCFYEQSIVNLDFHTAPHFGDKSVLEEHWAGARGKRMKGALSLFAQDATSKLILYTAADIKRSESDRQVLDFLKYWQEIPFKKDPTFIFDSKFTSYANLKELDLQGVKFITLRRRGQKLVEDASRLAPWQKIKIEHDKRKYPNPLVHDSTVELRGYDGVLRQVILTGNGREKPTFLISNDFETPVELLVGNYARRWRVENSIAEAVKFFHLNALSSPILIKIHFDLALTMIADTLYYRLAQHLRHFESCDADKLYRHFIEGQGHIVVQDGGIVVNYPKRAHNPILRAVKWENLPSRIPWLGNAPLEFKFR